MKAHDKFRKLSKRYVHEKIMLPRGIIKLYCGKKKDLTISDFRGRDSLILFCGYCGAEINDRT